MAAAATLGWFGFGPFPFAKCKYLWPQPPMHLELQTVRVSQRSEPGLHVEELTHQSFRAEVQTPLPLSEAVTKPGCSSPIPREMLSREMIWRRQTTLHCCCRNSLLARQGAERGSLDAASSSDVCSWEVWKPPGFLLSVIHACGGCENHFQKAMSSLCSPGFKFKHLMQSKELKNIV